MKPLAKTSTKWSSQLAYIIGLITTDGNLSSDGRHIIFVSKDLQLIKTFCKCLNIRNKIGLKNSRFNPNKIYHYVQFGDVNFYNFLLSIGLTPKKSKTLKGLKIPNKFFFDFLRGHFDGDGCCFSYWDKRWHSSFMFYITLISMSKEHILWLREEIKRLAKVKGYLAQIKRDGLYQLRYAKGESKVLISKMYHQEKLPCLLRKYEKIKLIIDTDKKEYNKNKMGG